MDPRTKRRESERREKYLRTKRKECANQAKDIRESSNIYQGIERLADRGPQGWIRESTKRIDILRILQGYIGPLINQYKFKFPILPTTSLSTQINLKSIQESRKRNMRIDQYGFESQKSNMRIEHNRTINRDASLSKIFSARKSGFFLWFRTSQLVPAPYHKILTCGKIVAPAWRHLAPRIPHRNLRKFSCEKKGAPPCATISSRKSAKFSLWEKGGSIVVPPCATKSSQYIAKNFPVRKSWH